MTKFPRKQLIMLKMDGLFTTDGDWNLNADFTKLTLPYYVATGDSIVAILLAPQQETYCLKTARYMRMVGFRDNRSRNQYCLNVQCAATTCNFAATVNVNIARIYPVCNTCFDMIFRARNNGAFTTLGDYLLYDSSHTLPILNNEGVLLNSKAFKKCVFTWPKVHPEYKDQALSVYVDYHYPRWRLVKELVGLLIELRTEIMKLFVMTVGVPF